VGHSVDFVNTGMAPFDGYSLSISAFVIERETGNPVPIVKLTAGQAPDNFDISSFETWTMSTYTFDSGAGQTTMEVLSRVVYIEAKRSRFAQALTLCLFLVNWALSVSSIYIVLLVISGTEGARDAVLVLPVTIVLTIPTIRNLYPGSLQLGIFIGKSRALKR
jgi:hypothetical protein